MAQILPTGGNALRMDFDIYRIGEANAVATRSAQSLVYEADGFRYAFTGTGLTYDGQGPTGGWLSSFEFSRDGTVLYSQTGLNLNPTVLRTPIGIGDHHLASFLLPGNDTLGGGDQDDWLRDIVGHNYLYGGSGADTLVGGDGNDHIYGHSPNGGADARDFVEGGGGSDYIQGNAGNDVLLGQGGSDRINGGADNDVLQGGDGNDSLNGNRGNDQVQGGDGDDMLRGGQGNDGLSGEDGNDILIGDLGADLLVGGAGSDIFVFGPTSSPFPFDYTFDRVMDFEDGIDHIALGFTPRAVLIGTTPFLSYDALRDTAQRLLDEHPGTGEVATIARGDTLLLFWSGAGGNQIDSMVQIDGRPLLSLDDFV